MTSVASPKYIKACPNPDCESEPEVEVKEGYGLYNVACYKCGMLGPAKKTRNGAVDAWNKLPRIVDIIEREIRK